MNVSGNIAGRLAGRVAIVTGAARGLGEAIAARLCEESCRVLVADIDGDEAAQVASRLSESERSDSCIARRVDVSRADDAQAMVGEVERRWGRLDILVNNAGIADFSPFDSISAGDMDRVLSVNLDSVLVCTRAASDLLARSTVARVLNLSSILAFRVVPECIPYCTSKGAIITLTRCLAVELAPRGIRVNAIAPGTFDTRMARLPDGSHEYEAQEFKDIYLKGGRLPLGRIGRLDELASAAYFFCSDDSSYVTGQTLLVDGGLSVRL